MLTDFHEQLLGYFDRLGWTVTQINGEQIESRWESDYGVKNLSASINSQVLYLRVSPLLILPDGEVGNELSMLLLELNEYAYKVRVGCQKNREVSVSIEEWIEVMNFERFETLISLICYYTDSFLDEIHTLLESRPTEIPDYGSSLGISC